MKFFATLFSIFLFMSIALQGQQNHFIYLQTENKQPFYVKVNNKLLSSSATGYLIIPKLTEGDYELTIGFPKNEWPEQAVNCIVKNKDLGFLLKNFDEKGWGLFNLQTMNLLMAIDKKATEKASLAKVENTSLPKDTIKTNNEIVSPSTTNPEIVKTGNSDPQKPMEAEKQPIQTAIVTDVKVVDVAKPKIETVPNVETTTQKEETKMVSNVSVTDTENLNEKSSIKTKNETKATPMVTGVTVKNVEETKPPNKPNNIDKQNENPLITIIEKPLPVTSNIKKIFSVNSSQGVDLVYEDEINGKADTIRIFIPNTVVAPKVESNTEIVDLAKSNKVKETPKNADAKFIDIELPNPNAQKDTIIRKIESTASVTSEKLANEQKQEPNIDKPILPNSDCKNQATDEDFLKLRKKMASEINNAAMTEVAKSTFKTMCFTTLQLKNLSVLFLNDEGKYRFFDAAYPFVSDSNNYSTLQTQLHDPYYVNRFKAMLRH